MTDHLGHWGERAAYLAATDKNMTQKKICCVIINRCPLDLRFLCFRFTKKFLVDSTVYMTDLLDLNVSDNLRLLFFSFNLKTRLTNM